MATSTELLPQLESTPAENVNETMVKKWQTAQDQLKRLQDVLLPLPIINLICLLENSFDRKYFANELPNNLDTRGNVEKDWPRLKSAIAVMAWLEHTWRWMVMVHNVVDPNRSAGSELGAPGKVISRLVPGVDLLTDKWRSVKGERKSLARKLPIFFSTAESQQAWDQLNTTVDSLLTTMAVANSNR